MHFHVYMLPSVIKPVYRSVQTTESTCNLLEWDPRMQEPFSYQTCIHTHLLFIKPAYKSKIIHLYLRCTSDLQKRTHISAYIIKHGSNINITNQNNPHVNYQCIIISYLLDMIHHHIPGCKLISDKILINNMYHAQLL